MKIAFTIFGQPSSKANSRRLVKFGDRPAVIKSKEALKYERDAALQIPPSARVMLEGPVCVRLRIFYASERPDLDESVVLDVLQAKYQRVGDKRELVARGCYINDRQVREKHVFHAIDRNNPRTEIEIEPLQPQQSPLIEPPQPRATPAQRRTVDDIDGIFTDRQPCTS